VVAAALAGASSVALGVSWDPPVGEAEPPPPDPAAVADRFATAWEAGRLQEMYALVDPATRERVAFGRFRRQYTAAARTATLRRVAVAGEARVRRGSARVPVIARTRLFGDVPATLALPLRLSASGDRYAVRWRPRLAFPGLLPGERLARRVRVPVRRGRILDRDGLVLASGAPAARAYPQGAAFAVVTGVLALPTGAAARARGGDGWPAGRPFGVDGLEASLDDALAGRPRIRLLARSAERVRRLATRRGRAPKDVRTTLDADLQFAASAALGARYGGAVLLDARTGAVRASAGIGMDGTQPPGSVFKVVTAAAALRAGEATLASTYPYARFVEIDGWKLRNFRRELCGGTLVDATATSCNSVYAPLAAALGGRRLVAAATDFGFNRRPTIAYPVPVSRTPPPHELRSDLYAGVAGIGQGGVIATPLQMASVAQTIAAGGRQRPPWIAISPRGVRDFAEPRRVVSPAVARDVATLMQAVVAYGSGQSAALAGVTVAGKTGTAEIGRGVRDTAWFIGYAPAEAPQYAVAIMIVRGGVGGEVAAPVAGQLLAAALAL
jgi:cell division protein FtsI/penicillin-binding protein 2